jgi:hypothetical protein
LEHPKEATQPNANIEHAIQDATPPTATAEHSKNINPSTAHLEHPKQATTRFLFLWSFILDPFLPKTDFNGFLTRAVA